VSADIGGGISLDDSARVLIVHNTIANNDSTATGVDAFGGACPEQVPGCIDNGEGLGGLTTSIPQPAGVVSEPHSTPLREAFGPGYEQDFSDPLLWNNIIRGNRSFWWDATLNGGFGGLVPDPAAPLYWDLGVSGLTAQLTPQFGILTSLLGPDGAVYDLTNSTADPGFVAPYVNVFEATSSGAALGNFVSIAFGPLVPAGDYHIGGPLPGANETYPASVSPSILLRLDTDFDGDLRAVDADVGADEWTP
jgi:hypothetical protein